jgi:hypothetical protein
MDVPVMGEARPATPKQEAMLREWMVVETTEGPRLCGTVYGHPAPYLKDGTHIITTPIVRINRDRGVAETQRTFYRLEGEERKINGR